MSVLISSVPDIPFGIPSHGLLLGPCRPCRILSISTPDGIRTWPWCFAGACRGSRVRDGAPEVFRPPLETRVVSRGI
jgi:hypothetical protein